MAREVKGQPTITVANLAYGAPMGRTAWRYEPAAPLRLFKVRLDGGGYDAGGAYWGRRAPGEYLWCCTDTKVWRSFHTAATRAQAMDMATAEIRSTVGSDASITWARACPSNSD